MATNDEIVDNNDISRKCEQQELLLEEFENRFYLKRGCVIPGMRK